MRLERMSEVGVDSKGGKLLVDGGRSCVAGKEDLGPRSFWCIPFAKESC